MKRELPLIVLGMVLACAVAGAAESDFTTCDGYGVPRGKSDGMTSTQALLFMSTSTDIRRDADTRVDADAVAACERALQDRALTSALWLRRASLLQARAVHQLAAELPEAALQSLAASDATNSDPAARDFRQSIVLGNRVVRVMALVGLGRKSEAAEELRQLELARPYALSVQTLARRLRLQLDDSPEAELASMRSLVPLNPNMAQSIFWYEVGQGRFADALKTARDVSFDMPTSRRGWVFEGASDPEAQQIAARADFTGALSYSLKATGDEAGASAQMDRAARELDDAGAPPEGRDGKAPSARALRAYEARRSQSEAGKRALNIWTTAMSMRTLAPRAAPGKFIEELSADRNVAGLPIAPDLLQQLTLAAPSDLVDRDRLVHQIRERLAQESRKASEVTIRRLFPLLPRAETQAARPRYRRAGDGYWISDNGFSFEKDPESDAVTVRFAHNVATPAVVEELALLSAALRARKEGKDLMLLQTRRTIVRTTHLTTYGYGSTTQDIPSGHEAQLKVVFLESARLPEAYRDAGARLLHVDDIISALADMYSAAEPVAGR